MCTSLLFRHRTDLCRHHRDRGESRRAALRLLRARGHGWWVKDLSKAGSWRCWGWHGGRRAPLGEQRAAEHQPKRNRANISVRLFPAWHSGTASKLGRQHFSWTWGHHAAPESPVGSFPSPRSGIEDGGKQNCPCGSSSAVKPCSDPQGEGWAAQCVFNVPQGIRAGIIPKEPCRALRPRCIAKSTQDRSAAILTRCSLHRVQT